MTAAHFDRVFFCGWPQIEHRFIGTETYRILVARRDFPGFDWSAFCCAPEQPFTRRPARVWRRVFCPGLRGAWHNVVVVSADELGHHVVIEPLHLFAIGNIDAFGPFYRNSLQVFRAHYCASTSSAAVVATVDHAGERHQIFPRLANRGDAGFRAGDATNFFSCGARPLTPQEIGFFDANLIVFNVDPDRRFGLAFNNNGVVTGEFHLCSKETAHMSIHD